MFGKALKISSQLSDEAHEVYQTIREYPTMDGMSNPVTRSIARKMVNSTWEKTLTEIDFAYCMTDCVIADVPCVSITTPMVKPDNPVILYIHAGAFIAGSARINAAAVLPAVQFAGCEAISVDYALAPEYKYPYQINQVVAVFLELTARYGAARPVIMMGDSAGANIALSAITKLRDAGHPLPVKTVLLSPCLDGMTSSDTLITLCKQDPLIKRAGVASLKNVFKYYAGRAELSDPGVSPIYASLRSLPPMLVQVGSREALLGDSARLSEAARQQKVPMTLRVLDGMFHLFHLHWSLPEAKSAHEDIVDFITP